MRERWGEEGGVEEGEGEGEGEASSSSSTVARYARVVEASTSGTDVGGGGLKSSLRPVGGKRRAKIDKSLFFGARARATPAAPLALACALRWWQGLGCF